MTFPSRLISAKVAVLCACWMGLALERPMLGNDLKGIGGPRKRTEVDYAAQRTHEICQKPLRRPCRERAPIMETLHDHWRTVLGFAGLSVFYAVGFYVSLVSWLQNADHIAHARALEINSFSMVILLVVVVASGLLFGGELSAIPETVHIAPEVGMGAVPLQPSTHDDTELNQRDCRTSD
jgi:hypothetical protein